MEESDGSPPQSLCMIRAAELFPKPQMEKEDTELTVPFQELAGESVKYLGRTDDGILALSNYRIFLLKTANNSETSVPLSLIESVQIRDLFHLIISCKDASTVKCSFETAEQCSESQRRIQLSVGVPETLESLFAFPFCSWTCDALASGNTNSNVNNTLGGAGGGGVGVGGGDSNSILTQNFGPINGLENLLPSSACSVPDYSERLQRASHYEDEFFMREVERLGFDLKAPWRISHANKDFKLCASYPQKILVPSCISDDTLHKVANFRGSRRLPAVVWRHRKSGAVIARCSQPEVGWLGWRNSEDEKLLKALADACAFDRGEQMRRMPQIPAEQVNNPTIVSAISSESSPSSPDGSHEEVPLDEVRKVLIVDARSYTSAVTNRARGGGCECIEYYPCAEIEFMNLGNIHAIRKSFHALRQLCASPPDVPNWLTLLEKTMWFQHLSGLLAASMTVCHAIEKKGRPVLVHCSDGWDRTPQLVATAQLCLDPYYRTVEGFRVLVEREWLSFGHKFADRCGHGPGSDELNERCPVFLQWLDLVHQIHKQFPCSFEFSMGYLIKLAQHSHSTLFGTFLCNTLKERIENSVFERTFSVWPFVSGPMYKNPLYIPNRDKVLWPAHNVRDLELWTEVYLGSLGNQNCTDIPTCNVADGSLNDSMSPVVKTRSYGDLITASILQNGISRRSSDPNMTVDPNLTMGSNSENTSVADIQSEREDSPDIIANLIHDTTRKLQNLTIELNTPDDDESFANTRNLENNLEKTSYGFQEPSAAAQQISNALIETNSDTDRQQQKQHQENQQHQISSSSKPTPLFSSPIIHVMSQEIDQLQQQQQQLQKFGCEKYTINNTKSVSEIFDTKSCEVNKISPLRQNGLSSSESTILNDNDMNCSEKTSNGVTCYEQLTSRGGITIHKTGNINLDLMQSVDLSGDHYFNTNNNTNGHSEVEQNISQENLWHGSINTSTDTLVPIENTRQPQKHQELQHFQNSHETDTENEDDIDGSGCSSRKRLEAITLPEFSSENRKSFANSSSILTKVHNNIKRPNALLYTSSSDISVSSSNSSLSNNLHKNNFTENVENNIDYISNNCDDEHHHHPSSCINNLMDESILILPEHQKLDISLSGKCETIPSNAVANATTQTVTGESNSNSGCALNVAPTNSAPSSSSYSYTPQYVTTAANQRRRRASSSNSRRDRDAFSSKQIYSGRIRSLPMTPPGFLPERPQIAFSCPDGLAHALSEQNIRLQQIVHEHKLREDALLREIHDMRMALLKKICPNCNNVPPSNDEQVDELKNTQIGKCMGVHKCCIRSNCSSQQRRHQRRKRQRLRRCCQHCRDSSQGFQKCNNFDERKEEVEVSILDEYGYGYLSDCSCNCHIEADVHDFDDDGDDYSSISACLAIDNVENASVCSWEAVEDRSGPSSCTSSSIQPNTTASVLWVPDHAVSRCTSCQTEFWLGRRKHHCRSCGQIFCADCSEFWAPLPDEKLFSPVRLCGPCYHAVTTRMQTSQFQCKSFALSQTQQQHQQLNADRNNVITASANCSTAATLSSTTTTSAASATVVAVTNTTLMTATSQA